MSMTPSAAQAIAYLGRYPTGTVNVTYVDGEGESSYYSLRYTYPAGTPTPYLLDGTGRIPGSLPGDVETWRDTITAGL